MQVIKSHVTNFKDNEEEYKFLSNFKKGQNKDIYKYFFNKEPYYFVPEVVTQINSIERDTYKYESVNQANIVFYVYLDDNTENNRNNIRTAIRILRELFPENLNIGSNKIPRFNFRINDILCVAFGDGDNKEILDNDEFRKPTDYNENICTYANSEIDPEQKCNEINDITLQISNNKLCKYEKDSCNLNNIYSYNKLLFNNSNKYSKYFLLDECSERKISSTKDLYEYIGVDVL
jgi:hypothetical protein